MLTFEEIVRKPQHALKKALVTELNRMGYRTRTKQGFTYGKGKLPVLLVAHMDTVHKETVKTICRSEDGKIVMSPQGIGGDDRAGVYMILQIIKKHRCHVLFCEDEETGGIGAREFAKSDIRPEINYIVELDRRGSNDAVFYECENPEFTEFVTSFGFKEELGSFSDISIIAPELKVAAVNISAGYYCEHSRHEYVDMDVVMKNIERVGKMVSAESQKFEYIEAFYFGRGRFGRGYYEDVWDFDRYYGKSGGGNVKTLMMLPDSTYIKTPGGDLTESDGQFYIDDARKLYEYLYDLNLAVEADGYEAMTENGTPVRFILKKAVEVEVVPIEYVIDALDERDWFDEEDNGEGLK